MKHIFFTTILSIFFHISFANSSDANSSEQPLLNRKQRKQIEKQDKFNQQLASSYIEKKQRERDIHQQLGNNTWCYMIGDTNSENNRKPKTTNPRHK